MILYKKPTKTNVDEKKYQFNILEDVNRDGSSIQITSGNTISEFLSTISHSYDNINYGCIGCKIGGFVGLYKLAKSSIGAKKISSLNTNNSVGSYSGVAEANEMDANQRGVSNPYSKMSDAMKTGGIGSAVGMGVGMATGSKIGNMVGSRLGKLSNGSLKKFVNASGNPTSSSRSLRKKFSKR